jgi:hypothetical protein
MRGPATQDPVQLVIGGVAFPSRVKRRLRDEVYLDALREGDQAFTPTPGQAVGLRYEDEWSYWSQQAVVVDVLDPIPLIVVRLTGEPQEIEVRAMPRARIGIPLEYSLMRPLAETYTTTTIDLSATGLRFPAAFQPWIGLDLRLMLRIEGHDTVLVGRVVRVAPMTEMRGRPAWVTAVQFIAPPPSARNRIADLVLKNLAQSRRAERRRVAQGARADAGPPDPGDA